MTTEENDQVETTAVADNTPQPSQEPPRPPKNNEDRSELIKFGVLVVVLGVIIAGVALSRPFIFDHVIPAVMGANLPPATVESGGSDDDTPAATPAAESENNAFIPALTTDQTDNAADATPTAEMVETAVQATPQPVTHVVQPGETLTKIAQQYNVTVQALLEANNLTNANYIQVGQTLVIPTNP